MTVDPVPIEAERLARKHVLEKAKAAGAKVAGIPASKWTRLALCEVEANKLAWIERAKLSLARSVKR